MDFATIIGLLIGFGAIFFAGYIGGTDPSIVFGRYEAIILILFGTLGATLTSFPMRIFIRGFFGGFKTAFVEVDYHERDVISTLVSFAEKARREGLLALENEAAALDDEFMRKGIQLVIDGRDTEIIRKVLETEVSNTQEKGGKAEAVFTMLGGYSPTLGIIGTVLGLIGMLKGLSTMGSSTNVAGTIGVATAQAFVATFFGIMFANLLWLPIAHEDQRAQRSTAADARDHDRRHPRDPGRRQPAPARGEAARLPRSARPRDGHRRGRTRRCRAGFLRVGGRSRTAQWPNR